MYISKYMTMAQLIREHPELGPFLRELGLACADCLSKVVDTVAVVAERYGMDVEDFLAALRAECAREHGQLP
ncbi:MAG: DUF1858 domain-containing protein [Firmicutes bacterium]|nr:DUF1858 domain-containing protein [Bacillota bacterium]